MFNGNVCWCKDFNGAFFSNHQNSGNGQGQQKADLRSNQRLQWKKNLFAIYAPFMMDSQLERIRKERDEQLSTRMRDTSAQKKRKKKLNQTQSLSESELMVAALINKALPLILERAREMRMLQELSCALQGTDNNKLARAAASACGCGDIFHLLSHSQEAEEASLVYCGGISLYQGMLGICKAADIIGRPVTNATEFDVWCEIDGHKFSVPAHCRFLTSSFQHFVSHGFQQLQVDSGYDLVVLDPPWMNKSVKRKKSYHTLAEDDLVRVPIGDLCRHGSLVCIWVTNNSRQSEFVTERLFPSWSVRRLAKWVWMKVTLNGEPVCDLYSSHKKPYEQIIIGRYEGNMSPRVFHSSMISREPEDYSSSKVCQCNREASDQNNTAGDSYSVTYTHKTANSASEYFTSCYNKEDIPSHKEKATPSGDQLALLLTSGTCSNSEGFHGSDADLKPSRLYKVVNQRESHGNQASANVPGCFVEPADNHKVVSEGKSHVSLAAPAEIPESFVLVSVPCALHSKKPPLGDVLQPYLPARPKCLEMFARNLTKGWSCWGDEPLRHQHIDYFETVST